MKNNKLNILVVSSNYPSKALPNYGAFVYTLMQELGKQHEITIISPYKVHNLLKKKKKTYGKERCRVFRPLFYSFSNKKILNIDFGKISSILYKKAIVRVMRRLPEKFDLVYTHFLYNSKHVLEYVSENNIPLIVASGESSFHYWDRIPEPLQTRLREKVTHLICVSNENKKELIKLGFDDNKMSVIPNAVNYSLFKPLDKPACKEKLDISKEKFIVGFIGHFIHRKGPNRIIEAITLLEDQDIQLVCVGSRGELTPNTFTKILEPVPNYQLPEIFNAFDVFVLPTLSEGHCNVIEEAKACAIPIISSKGTSVQEQIDDTTGILINPLQIKEIADAISKLKNDFLLRERMVENLIKRRGENSIQERANKISSILLQTV